MATSTLASQAGVHHADLSDRGGAPEMPKGVPGGSGYACRTRGQIHHLGRGVRNQFVIVQNSVVEALRHRSQRSFRTSVRGRDNATRTPLAVVMTSSSVDCPSATLGRDWRKWFPHGSLPVLRRRAVSQCIARTKSNEVVRHSKQTRRRVGDGEEWRMSDSE